MDKLKWVNNHINERKFLNKKSSVLLLIEMVCIILKFKKNPFTPRVNYGCLLYTSDAADE